MTNVSSVDKKGARRGKVESGVHGNSGLINKASGNKRAPAYNALKCGVYSNSLMPGEDPAHVQELFVGLCQEFGVCGAAGEILVRQLVQATLQTRRLEGAQAQKVRGALDTRAARFEFRTLALLEQVPLPDWYFGLDESDYARARLMARCLDQARHLQQNHSADRVMKAASLYPELHDLVMGPPGPRHQMYTFGEFLSSLYKDPSPVLNVQELVREMERDFAMEVQWAQNEARFMSVLRTVMAHAEIAVRSDPNMQRAEVMLHKKTQSLIGQLLHLKGLAGDRGLALESLPLATA